MRVATAVEGWRRVARRGGEPVAELVHDDDEIFGRIERAARRDEPFEIGMLRAVGGGVDDDVRLRGVERAVRLVSELGVTVGQAGLQHYIAGLEDLVIGHASGSPTFGAATGSITCVLRDARFVGSSG